MGLVARALNASIPFPVSNGKTFYGWGSQMVAGGGSTPFRLPDESDYRLRVGDGGGTMLLTAAINWMGRELIPARRSLLEYADESGVARSIRMHAVLELLANPTRDPLEAPNGYIDANSMDMACAASWIVDGNVYRWKIRSPMKRVVQYWYVPHFLIEPIGTKNRFIDHYRYTVGGEQFKIDPADISHLRFGLDPRNPRKGLSPVRGLLRELYTDEEAARFSAALLHNVAFPGAVVIPGKDVIAEEADRKEIRDTFDARFAGEGRGRTIVLGANADVKFLQWSPKDLDLSSMRDVPEERMSSALGIPAAILGLGAGMSQVKVGATLETLQAIAWSSALIPFLTAMSDNDTRSLLPEFMSGAELARHELGWDLSKIAALSEVRLRAAEVEATLVRSGIKMVDESRMVLGYPAVGGTAGGFQASPGVGSSSSSGSSGNGDQGANDQSPAARRARTAEAQALLEEEAEGEPDAAAEGLSLRELAIIDHVSHGRTNKAIADTLRTTERTVQRSISRAMEKTGAVSRADLVTRARSTIAAG